MLSVPLSFFERHQQLEGDHDHHDQSGGRDDPPKDGEVVVGPQAGAQNSGDEVFEQFR